MSCLFDNYPPAGADLCRLLALKKLYRAGFTDQHLIILLFICRPSLGKVSSEKPGSQDLIQEADNFLDFIR